MASNMQIESLAQDIAKEQHTMQADIIKRFLTDVEYQKFLKAYNANRKSLGFHGNREESLGGTIPTAELELLKKYISDFGSSIEEMATSLGIRPTIAHSRIYRAAVKLIYQNKDKLGL